MSPSKAVWVVIVVALGGILIDSAMASGDGAVTTFVIAADCFWFITFVTPAKVSVKRHIVNIGFFAFAMYLVYDCGHVNGWNELGSKVRAILKHDHAIPETIKTFDL